MYSNTGKRKITALSTRLVSEAQAAVAGDAEWGSFAGGACTEAGFELKGYHARVTAAMIDLGPRTRSACAGTATPHSWTSDELANVVVEFVLAVH